MVVTVSSSLSYELLLPDLFPILQCLHRFSSAAHLDLMGSFIIVVFQPVVQILLQLLKAAIELLSERDLIEGLVQDQDRLVKDARRYRWAIPGHYLCIRSGSDRPRPPSLPQRLDPAL